MPAIGKRTYARSLDALDATAETMERFIERHMVDPDGLVYSTINEQTQAAWRDSQIPKRVVFNCVDAPRQLWKAGFFNYEDSNMATAEYLLANVYKHTVSGDRQAAARARRCFEALRAVARQGAKYHGFTVKPALGFLPKPYGGIVHACKCGEVSVDQYQRTMYALETYRDALAAPAQRQWINKFLAACADCWSDNNYSFNYMLGIWRWGILLPHSVAFALYCSAIGRRLSHEHLTTHKHWYAIFLERVAPLQRQAQPSTTANVAALTAMAMKRLVRLDRARAKQWKRYIANVITWARWSVNEHGYSWLFGFLAGNKHRKKIKPHWEGTHRYWNFLAWRGNIFVPAASLPAACLDAYEVVGKPGHLDYALRLLKKLGRREYLKWIKPEGPGDLPEGYEMLGNAISGLNTACWLRAYWQARYLLQR